MDVRLRLLPRWPIAQLLRMGGRVVEGTGLENRQGFAPFVGSNPTPSATLVRGAIGRHAAPYLSTAGLSPAFVGSSFRACVTSNYLY